MAGINAFDLASEFCPDCGQAKSLRLAAYLTGCATCDEIRTRHRCEGRPLAFEQADDAEWSCDGCGAVYRIRVEVEEIEHRMWETLTPAVREGPRQSQPWRGLIR